MTLLKKEYNDVSYISGPLLFVNAASDLAYGAIVDIRDGSGRTRGGQVIEVSEEHAVIQIFEDTRGLDLASASVSLVEDVARLGVSKDMIGRRFDMALDRLHMNRRRLKLRTDLFTPPRPQTGQLSLF